MSSEIEYIGSIDYSIVAINEAGVEGRSKVGVLLTEALRANIISVKVTPTKAYVGEEYLITASTDNPASSVSLVLDDLTYKMGGSGKNWTFKKRISEAGKKTFTVIAENIEGRNGKSMSGEIIARMAVPDVTTIAFKPEGIFAGDSFVIKVTTSSPADEVVFELDGKGHIMEGASTEWRYEFLIDTVGSWSYKVLAQNKEGKIGLTKEGKINALKKPTALITVAKVEVTPVKGYSGGKFKFKASTDRPALKVTLALGGESFEMSGSGTEWSLSKVIKKTGDMVFSIAAFNEDNVEGGAKTAQFLVEEIKERYAYNKDGTITDKVTGEVRKRFVDNGDGTVTDLATNLMWLKKPKMISTNYEEADNYCRALSIGGKTGWRLPTISEWKYLLDRNQRNPALPPGHLFLNINTRLGYWSKSKHKFGSLYVYQVSLWDGKTAYLSKKKIASVWPVRYVEMEERIAEVAN